MYEYLSFMSELACMKEPSFGNEVVSESTRERHRPTILFR